MADSAISLPKFLQVKEAVSHPFLTPASDLSVIDNLRLGREPTGPARIGLCFVLISIIEIGTSIGRLPFVVAL